MIIQLQNLSYPPHITLAVYRPRALNFQVLAVVKNPKVRKTSMVLQGPGFEVFGGEDGAVEMDCYVFETVYYNGHHGDLGS